MRPTWPFDQKIRDLSLDGRSDTSVRGAIRLSAVFPPPAAALGRHGLLAALGRGHRARRPKSAWGVALFAGVGMALTLVAHRPAPPPAGRAARPRLRPTPSPASPITAAFSRPSAAELRDAAAAKGRPSPWSASTSTTSRRSTRPRPSLRGWRPAGGWRAAPCSSVRGDDTAARTGGEEFALILPGTDAEDAQEIAERVRTAVAAPLARGIRAHLLGRGRRLSRSTPTTPDALLQLAEGALYWAKRSGKSRTRRFDPDHVRSRGDAPQRSEIERILASGRSSPSSSRRRRSPRAA